MNSNAHLRRGRRQHVVSACLFFAFLAALVSPSVAADGSKPPPARTKYPIPDLVMIVWVTEQMDRVSFTYNKAVKRDAVEIRLGNLLRETAWTANDIHIEDLKMADGATTTTVEFTTLGTVNLQSGGFPLAPIIKTFKDLKYLEIQFMVSMPFNFRGLRHFENKHVKIALNRGTNVYGYSIFIKDPNFKTLDLPLVQPETTAASRPAGAGRTKLLGLMLTLMLGFFAAMLVYFIMKRATGSRES